MRRRIAVPLMLATVLAACTGRSGPGSAPHSPDERGALTGRHACANAPGFSCSTLTVPLDHSGGAHGPQPAERPAPRTHLPPVPVLLLAGGRDLSTPLEWARQEAAKAPVHQLVVAAGDGHSVQSRGMTPQLRQVLERFLRS